MKDDLAMLLLKLGAQLDGASELLDKADTTPFGQMEKLLDGIAGRVSVARRCLDEMAKLREFA